LANNIVHVAIHDLKRTQDGFAVQLGNPNLPVNTTTQRVIDDLYDLYRRRASKSHGKFSASPDAAPTQGHLQDYLGSSFAGFAKLTEAMMATLQDRARLRGAAHGGHVFYAHFERDGRHFLLVAIITDKLGAVLTKRFDVEDVEHLDMDGFRFAGRVDLSGWSNGEERYIGFLKGKGDVSEYFKEFLGCDNAVQARQDTTELVQALKSFADKRRMQPEQKNAFLARAKDICTRASKTHTELSFEALANELMPESPRTLLDELASSELSLNDNFVPDSRALASLVRYKGRTPQWSVEFDREALADGKVLFDRHNNTLTLTDLPADLAAQLQGEFSTDAKD